MFPDSADVTALCRTGQGGSRTAAENVFQITERQRSECLQSLSPGESALFKQTDAFRSEGANQIAGNGAGGVIFLFMLTGDDTHLVTE